jgi:response regulator RpfG family c-di-GMP phosphodiesterase
VILDLVLPDGRGTDVCRELRRWSSAPVLLLSVVGDEREKVAALDAGADDYVEKPFGTEELLARLRAALRRAVPSGDPVLEIGELVIDVENRTVTKARAIGHARGVNVRTTVQRARLAGEAIVEAAEDAKAELVVLHAPRKEPVGPRRKPFGKTVDYVLKHAPSRVMVAAPPCPSTRLTPRR